METFLYGEVNAISILILLVLAIKARTFGFDRSLKNKLFIAAAGLSATAATADTLWKVCCDGYLNLPLKVLWLLNAVYFLAFSGSAYCWALHVELYRHRNALRRKRVLLVDMAPLAAIAVLLVLSYFNGCIFYLDEQGQYYRGPLYFLHALFSYGMVLWVLIKGYVCEFRRDSYVGRSRMRQLWSFTLPLLLALVIQFIAPQYPLVAPGMAIACLMLYLTSLQDMVAQDPVTGISNRRQLLLYLASRMERVRSEETLYFLFIDIDAFKQINDTHGHEEGDRVLKTIARLLKQNCDKAKAGCGRYGGDEFALVQSLPKDTPITGFCRMFNDWLAQELKKQGVTYVVNVSIGWAAYRGKPETVSELIARADSAMYAEKKRKKAAKF